MIKNDLMHKLVYKGCILAFAAFIFLQGSVQAQNKQGDVREIPVIKPWKIIVQDKDYNGAWTVSGDLTGNGIPELVCGRSYAAEGEHYTASAIAYTLEDKVLWTWGNPGDMGQGVGSDLACQVYDWDNDGSNEVILSTWQDGKTWLVELEGSTGKEKRRFEIPAGAADCFTFCNISGEPFSHPSDIIVKTRYSQLWAYDYMGNQLWTIYRPGKHSTAHQAVPFDLDLDGIDEIMTGYVMVDHEGNPMWIADRSGTSNAGHLDCVRQYYQSHKYIVYKIKNPSPSWSKLVLTYCNGRRISMVNGVGELIWGISGRHFQSIDIGKVRPDLLGKQIIVDVGADDPEENGIWILDGDGNVLTIIAREKCRTHRLINWDSADTECILISDDRALYNGHGKKLVLFDTPIPQGAVPLEENAEMLAFTGDMSGDAIPDVVLYTNPGSVIYVFKNENDIKPRGNVPLGSGVNYTLY
jgi:hypothetical protein